MGGRGSATFINFLSTSSSIPIWGKCRERRRSEVRNYQITDDEPRRKTSHLCGSFVRRDSWVALMLFLCSEVEWKVLLVALSNHISVHVSLYFTNSLFTSLWPPSWLFSHRLVCKHRAALLQKLKYRLRQGQLKMIYLREWIHFHFDVQNPRNFKF